MKRFSTVALGAAILMVTTSVLAVDGTTVARRASRQDILSGHVQATSSNPAPIVADRADRAVLDQGLQPVEPVLPPELDVQGVVQQTRNGMYVEGIEVNWEARRNDLHSSLVFDRVELDYNEMAEALSAKAVTVRPIVDRPILVGN